MSTDHSEIWKHNQDISDSPPFAVEAYPSLLVLSENYIFASELVLLRICNTSGEAFGHQLLDCIKSVVPKLRAEALGNELVLLRICNTSGTPFGYQ